MDRSPSLKEAYLGSLDPSTDAQKRALATARETIESIGQARLQMSFALNDPVSYPLPVVVIAWGSACFAGFASCWAAIP